MTPGIGLKYRVLNDGNVELGVRPPASAVCSLPRRCSVSLVHPACGFLSHPTHTAFAFAFAAVADGPGEGQRGVHRLPQARERRGRRGVRGGGLLRELSPAQLPRVGTLFVRSCGGPLSSPLMCVVYCLSHSVSIIHHPPTCSLSPPTHPQRRGRLLLLHRRGRGAGELHLSHHRPGQASMLASTHTST